MAPRQNREPRKPDIIDQVIAGFVMLMFWPLFAWSGPCDQFRAPLTREAQFRFGIPAPTPVIAAQTSQESACNPLAKSRVGASGLLQFMPQTAQWAASTAHLGAAEPTNPQWAIRAGVWYDRWLFERVQTFDTECDRWQFTLSGYNGGLGYVYKRQKMSSRPGSYLVTGYLNPGIAPANQVENQTYAPRILWKHQPGFKAWGKTVCLP